MIPFDLEMWQFQIVQFITTFEEDSALYAIYISFQIPRLPEFRQIRCDLMLFFILVFNKYFLSSVHQACGKDKDKAKDT